MIHSSNGHHQVAHLIYPPARAYTWQATNIILNVPVGARQGDTTIEKAFERMRKNAVLGG
jgi:hypothetical protein